MKCDYNTSNGYLTFFEDNQSYIAVEESKNLPTRTKHIVINWHHFRNYLQDSIIKIDYIDTKKQLVEILTKPIESNQFFKLRYALMGW